MARTNRRRSEKSPFVMKLSPGEWAAFRAKAKRAGLGLSAAGRAALEAWEPGGVAPPVTAPRSGVTVVYDEQG